VLFRAGPIRPQVGKFTQMQDLMVFAPRHIAQVESTERENFEGRLHESIQAQAAAENDRLRQEVLRLKNKVRERARAIKREHEEAREARSAKVTPELVSRLQVLTRLDPLGRRHITQSLSPGEGWGFCAKHEHSTAIFGRSGPHTHDSVSGAPIPPMSCGCFSYIPGKDHKLNPDFVVVVRGQQWQATYEVTEDFVRLHKAKFAKGRNNVRTDRTQSTTNATRADPKGGGTRRGGRR